MNYIRLYKDHIKHQETERKQRIRRCFLEF